MNAIATTAPTHEEVVRVLQSSLYPGARLESIELVLSYCKVNQLDPMLKPVHIVPTRTRIEGTDKWETRDTLMPGIALYRILAARSYAYAGKSEPEYGPNRTEKIGGVEVTYPEWCRVTVSRIVQGQLCKYTAKELWSENVATTRAGVPTEMWQKRAYGQLAKCTEAQALRMAFPEYSGGAPTAEEMEGKETLGAPIIDAKPEPAQSTDRDKINAEVPLEARSEQSVADQPKRMTWTQLLKSFELAIGDAMTAEEIQTILRSPQMTEAKAHIAKARPEHQQKLDEIMILADTKLRDLEATTPTEAEGETLDIFGEEKVTAG